MTLTTLIAVYDPIAGWLGLALVLYTVFWLVVTGLGRLGVWEALVDPEKLDQVDDMFSPEFVLYGGLAQTIVLVCYLTVQTVWRLFT